MKCKKLILSLCFLFIGLAVMAQDILVKGHIISKSDGQPVIGATIVETGTPKNGAITDIDGNFTIKVPAKSTLSVSYIGYKTSVVNAEPTMTVTLIDDSQLMDELVVTGYSVQRKADLSGAVSVMDMNQPASEANANVLNSMQGRLAGVQITTDASPGSGSTAIRVRGMSTVNGNDPLFVIDGIPTTENLNSLNAADIESIQVLKDASSASIYGSRAANGVIIITTKKGKGNKLSVNVNISGSMQSVMKQHKMLNAQQWGEAYWTANKNAGLKPSHVFYGSGETPQLVGYLDGQAGLVKSTNNNWQDAIYQTAWAENIGASISNSGEKGSVMFSTNFLNQDGIMQNSYFRRYSVRLNSNYKLSNYVNVGENLMISKWDNRGFSTNDDRGVTYTAMRQHPAIPVYDSRGNFTNPLTLASSDIANPVQTLYNGRDNSNDNWRIFGNAYIEVMPVKGLTLKSNLGIEHLQYLNRNLTRKVQSSDKNSVTRDYGQGDTWTWTNTANYNLNVGDHHLNVLGGVEAISYRYENISIYRDGFAFEDDDYMNPDAGEGTQTNGGNRASWSLFSLFAKADYNYADKYLLSATIRRDATSRLYKNNNSGIFPAFSGAWRFTQESFFPTNNVLTNGKVRVGWGQNGNSAISSNYASYSTYAYNKGNGAYDLNGSNVNTVAGIIVATSGNKDLKWETTTQTNIGLDLNFFSNSLNLSFDYYFKNTKDMLTIPPTLSVEGENAAVWMNTGTMENKGFEVTLDYKSPNYNDFSWGGMLNFSKYSNKVVQLNSLVKSIGGDIRLMEGQPMGVYYGYIADGIFKTNDEVSNHATQQGKDVGRIKYRDIDGNGIVNEKDQCIIGDPNPDFSMGLNLDFRYKGFTLSAFFTGDFGFDIYNTTKRQLDFMSFGGTSTNRGESVLGAWSKDNVNSLIPALSAVDNNNETRMSTYFIENGSYLKMKYVKVQYELPKKVIKAISANNVSVYGQVENLFTLTKYSGLDPELPLGGYGARVDNAPYPISRTVTLGVNVQF